jgi:hypothetical protein
VIVHFTNQKRIITATTTRGVTLTHTLSTPGARDDTLILSGSILTEVEGSTDEEVRLERQSKLRAVVSWHGGDKQRTLPVELILPGKQHELAALPDLAPIPVQFLPALHECGRSAAKENGRFALSHVQVQGRSGRVVGTDGKVALLWSGFKFPFSEDVLVPAIPVFGSKVLTRIKEVSVGLTPTHLIVAADTWMIWLPVQAKARYPDVASVIPKLHSTTVSIDKQDATELLKSLPTLPGNSEELRPITLAADPVVKILARAPKTSETGEVTLGRSQATGPAARVALDRRILARAVSLGCLTLKMSADKPVVAEGDGVTLIVAPLESFQIVTPTTEARKALPSSNPKPELPQSERSVSVRPPENNGHSSQPRGDPIDPLAAAEDLRIALADAATKAARLVAALKQSKKEKKVLSAVLTNLKQLNLGTGEQP